MKLLALTCIFLEEAGPLAICLRGGGFYEPMPNGEPKAGLSLHRILSSKVENFAGPTPLLFEQPDDAFRHNDATAVCLRDSQRANLRIEAALAGPLAGWHTPTVRPAQPTLTVMSVPVSSFVVRRPDRGQGTKPLRGLEISLAAHDSSTSVRVGHWPGIEEHRALAPIQLQPYSDRGSVRLPNAQHHGHWLARTAGVFLDALGEDARDEMELFYLLCCSGRMPWPVFHDWLVARGCAGVKEAKDLLLRISWRPDPTLLAQAIVGTKMEANTNV